ncbi:MAG: crosslink repair DNA glycosylase YcaQ family protein [Patescibacteria group bacterium]
MHHIKTTKEKIRKLSIQKQLLTADAKPTIYEVFKQLGCVQLDPISVVAPSHELVLWSRLGNYNKQELEDLRWKHKLLFEYLAHAASIVLTKENTSLNNWLSKIKDHKEITKQILQELKQHKQVLSKDLGDESHKSDTASRWWSGRYVPNILYALWLQGEVAVVGRKDKQKLYGIAEEFFTANTPQENFTDEQLTRHNILRSLQILGVATPKQIKNNYTRNRYPTFKKTFEELLQEGLIIPVEIEDYNYVKKESWYIHSNDVEALENVNNTFEPTTKLLSPFDNLICDRDRLETIWDFSYRIEIYTPPKKRVYGYYVLPILHEDKLIGRVDLKKDKTKDNLNVVNIYWENLFVSKTVKETVITTLTELQTFLGLKSLQLPTNF